LPNVTSFTVKTWPVTEPVNDAKSTSPVPQIAWLNSWMTVAAIESMPWDLAS
jgi:hypothetical protein